MPTYATVADARKLWPRLATLRDDDLHQIGNCPVAGVCENVTKPRLNVHAIHAALFVKGIFNTHRPLSFLQISGNRLSGQGVIEDVPFEEEGSSDVTHSPVRRYLSIASAVGGETA